MGRMGVIASYQPTHGKLCFLANDIKTDPFSDHQELATWFTPFSFPSRIITKRFTAGLRRNSTWTQTYPQCLRLGFSFEVPPPVSLSFHELTLPRQIRFPNRSRIRFPS